MAQEKMVLNSMKALNPPSPRHPITAKVSQDGLFVHLFLLPETIGRRMAINSEAYGPRKWRQLSEEASGELVEDFIDGDGTKWGTMTLDAQQCGFPPLIPNKEFTWYSPYEYQKYMIGQLFMRLFRDPDLYQPPRTSKPVLTAMPEPINPGKKSLEEALKFINDWVRQNGAHLVVEDGILFIELQ